MWKEEKNTFQDEERNHLNQVWNEHGILIEKRLISEQLGLIRRIGLAHWFSIILTS